MLPLVYDIVMSAETDMAFASRKSFKSSWVKVSAVGTNVLVHIEKVKKAGLISIIPCSSETLISSETLDSGSIGGGTGVS